MTDAGRTHPERRSRWCRRLGTDGPLLGTPLGPSTVQQGHVAMAVVVENPPQPGGIDPTPFVVRNHAGVGADAEATHQRFELGRRGQEIRRGLGVANPVVVEPDGVGNVPLAVATGTQIDNPHLRIGGMGGDPGGVDEQVGTGIASRRHLHRQQESEQQRHATDCTRAGCRRCN